MRERLCCWLGLGALVPRGCFLRLFTFDTQTRRGPPYYVSSYFFCLSFDSASALRCRDFLYFCPLSEGLIYLGGIILLFTPSLHRKAWH